jgi:hypothetical protein
MSFCLKVKTYIPFKNIIPDTADNKASIEFYGDGDALVP